MSAGLIAFLFALGAGAWVYNQAQKRNGGLTQKSLIVAAFVGVIAFIIMLTLAATLVPSN